MFKKFFAKLTGSYEQKLNDMAAQKSNIEERAKEDALLQKQLAEERRESNIRSMPQEQREDSQRSDVEATVGNRDKVA